MLGWETLTWRNWEEEVVAGPARNALARPFALEREIATCVDDWCRSARPEVSFGILPPSQKEHL